MDIFEYGTSASKRGPLKSVDISERELVQSVETGEDLLGGPVCGSGVTLMTFPTTSPITHTATRHPPAYPMPSSPTSPRCLRHDLAWDCATGNGQAALGLTPHFRIVVAAAASLQPDRPGSSPSEGHLPRRSRRKNASLGRLVDLVTVATAFHWLDFPDSTPRFGESLNLMASSPLGATKCQASPRKWMP